MVKVTEFFPVYENIIPEVRSSAPFLSLSPFIQGLSCIKVCNILTRSNILICNLTYLGFLTLRDLSSNGLYTFKF